MTAVVKKQTSVRVDKRAWDATKEVCKEYGMSVSDAINLFLNQVRIHRGIPFDIYLPSDRLKKAIDELENGEVEKFDNIEEMLKDLKS
jgi:DNA-damage-inducible protein J